MKKGKKTIYFVRTPDHAERRVDPEQSCLPLLPKERHITFWAMMGIMTAGSIASWAFIAGGSLGALVPAKYAIIAAFFGCTVALMIHGYFCITYARYGADMSVLGRSVWGHRGSTVIIIAVGFVSTYGWGSMPIIMLGKSIAMVLRNWNFPSFFTNWRIWAIIMLAVGLLITYYGTTMIDKISRFTAPIILILMIFICVILIREYGVTSSLNSLPENVTGNRDELIRNYMIAVEIALGVGFSWPFTVSAYTKPVISEQAAYTPNIVGCGLAWAACTVAPIITTIMAGTSDPVEALYTVGGVYANIWLIMLAFANFSSIMTNPYFLATSTSAMFPKLKWKICVLIQGLFIVAIIFPVFYERFGTAISFIAVVEGPCGCIWALGYFLNKKINLRHCVAKGEERKKSAYWFTAGFNPAAFIGLVVGSAFGIWLYNPWTNHIAVGEFFDLFGAILPASAIGTLVYYLIYRFYQLPRMIGKPEFHESVDEYVMHNEKVQELA